MCVIHKHAETAQTLKSFDCHGRPTPQTIRLFYFCVSVSTIPALSATREPNPRLPRLGPHEGR